MSESIRSRIEREGGPGRMVRPRPVHLTKTQARSRNGASLRVPGETGGRKGLMSVNLYSKWYGGT